MAVSWQRRFWTPSTVVVVVALAALPLAFLQSP